MELTITPDIRSLIQHELDTGRYESAEEVVKDALVLMGHGGATITHAEFQAMLDEGWNQAERGETISPEEARRHLAEARAERLRA